jgi:hypothetical protein
MQAMADIEYPVASGESDEEVWRRAIADFHSYWRRG